MSIYLHDYVLELPVLVDAHVIAWCPDIPCRLILDECGDLWKVEFRERGTDRLLSVMSGPLFEAAQEAMAWDGDRIRDEAGFRGSRRERDTAPTYGVGFNGASYAA